ncbi:MAG TPA: lantibiotic dehydratase [Myxococcus sp.]|nr:lantibiotic dehydratase [Myxococcus sp.]
MNDTRSPARDASAFRDDGFLAIRTPLLPLDVLVEWSRGLKAPEARPEEREAALAEDRALLRQRLRAHVEDPLVREALFIASPSLDESLPAWLERPDSEAGLKVEHTLVRYLARMAGRATPFGLFAGHAVGGVGGATALRVGGRSGIRRHTRLDMDYVGALVAHVCRTPEVVRELRYVPNSSLYRAGGQLRYLESRQNNRERAYHLVAVEPEPVLDATLERAGAALGGVTLEELAGPLAAEADVPREEALEYLESLVSAQLLVPAWAPLVTGPEPLPVLLEGARALPVLAPVCQKLAAVGEALARIDASPVGLPPEAYREAARPLEALPVPVEMSRLFQVDMFRAPGEVRLPRGVVDEVLRGVMALRRMMPTQGDSHPIARFKQRFLERYEGRPVPLLEALDEESGIGFSPSQAPGAGTGPLLAGFRFPSKAEREGSRWEPRWTHLLHRLEDVRHTGARELVLDEADVKALEAPAAAELPDAFGVVGSLLAESAAAVDAGRYRFLLENAHGPSGALYLGRFCHGDAALEEAVRRYLRAEEALRPDAVFAEVVHLPEGRVGNVICRPALRGHDLVFLGQSGVAPEGRIPLSDVWVSVEAGRVVLRSGRLGREVLPRLTNAHNFSARGLGAYRFLGALQSQSAGGLSFRWGPLDQAPFLPRVVLGRVVLEPATWNVRAATLRAWGEARGVARFEAVQRFREQARLPRWVCLRDGDNQLPVDLDNVLCVETLVQLVRSRPQATLEELLPGPEDVCVEGEAGRYTHEVVIPFVRRQPAEAPVEVSTAARVRAEAPPPAALKRRFPPGTEWLYLKLYAGTGTLERLLRTSLLEAVRKVEATGAADRWFFIRYHDPEPHVRLRFHGEPRRLESEVWPLLRETCEAALSADEAWRVQLDTYEREVERYGGPAGIEWAEALFHADSEAVLALLEAYPGDEGADARWRLALKGLDGLLEALSLGLEEKAVLLRRVRQSFAAEHRVDKRFEEQLATRYRKESRALEALLRATPADGGPWRPGLEILQRRAGRLAPVAGALRRAGAEGRLTVPVEALAGSFLHMHVNRVLPADQRAQELILYDFLSRLYRSRQARMKTQT